MKEDDESDRSFDRACLSCESPGTLCSRAFFHTGCISVRRLPTQDGIRDNEYERRCSSLTDEEYMQRALELAMRGAGWVNPNPLVGAVVVRDGRIIGEGWHPAFGELHAERQAHR